jgi:hypothetical protein
MTTITCTGCGGERIMVPIDQIDVPENGLCELELDACPSDQELLMLEAFDALKRVAIWCDDVKMRHSARDKHEELTGMWEAVSIYTPTPYHQTGGTTPAENNNKEE